jgi:Uncharacterized protein conserved in bacteria (DUF2059)
MEVAEELASIRVERSIHPARMKSDFGRRYAERLSKIQRDLLVEKYLEHYSNAQLRALKEFYESKIGRSIVETDRAIEAEFLDELRIRVGKIDHEFGEEHVSAPEGGNANVFLASSAGPSDEP